MQHEHEKNMTRLWCKIVPKTSVEYFKENEGFYFYLYTFGNLVQGTSKEAFMCASNKKTS